MLIHKHKDGYLPKTIFSVTYLIVFKVFFIYIRLGNLHCQNNVHVCPILKSCCMKLVLQIFQQKVKSYKKNPHH